MEQRLLFRAGGQGFQRGRVADHRDGLGRQGGNRSEIGEDASAQIAGLAHIDDASLRILVQIDARCRGQGRGWGTFHKILRLATVTGIL